MHFDDDVSLSLKITQSKFRPTRGSAVGVPVCHLVTAKGKCRMEPVVETLRTMTSDEGHIPRGEVLRRNAVSGSWQQRHKNRPSKLVKRCFLNALLVPHFMRAFLHHFVAKRTARGLKVPSAFAEFAQALTLLCSMQGARCGWADSQTRPVQTA